ncbi:ladderlectin-like isoform X1 [Melanotaenia boesemani]|uniref:ladderlectin-like isoform X1 n=1 Tax=Melanotaenia boesemani TaxID=1250792 RepID=UPI001C0414AE|nr:ladderlectin-like isoform X1 [Melanotaenia boesemani]
MKIQTLPLLLCAVMTLTGATKKWSSTCPDNWTKINGRCFGYVLTPMSWRAAERNCVSMGGHLASVHSAQEYQDVQSLVWSITRNYNEAWIGGSDQTKEGVWTWTDRTTFFFKSWCPGEPNNFGTGQHCLHINHTGKRCWDDNWCHIKLPSVCAKKI